VRSPSFLSFCFSAAARKFFSPSLVVLALIDTIVVGYEAHLVGGARPYFAGDGAGDAAGALTGVLTAAAPDVPAFTHTGTGLAGPCDWGGGDWWA
jgi:hypothetical protein